MSLRVLITPLADQQLTALRRKDAEVLNEFIRDLATRGCVALSYRLTGPPPLEHLCVKHFARQLRVVVGFTSTDAWILLIGPHHSSDPGIDVYSTLYALADTSPPDSAKRTKPPCCRRDGTPPTDHDAIEKLAQRAIRVRRTRR